MRLEYLGRYVTEYVNVLNLFGGRWMDIYIRRPCTLQGVSNHSSIRKRIYQPKSCPMQGCQWSLDICWSPGKRNAPMTESLRVKIGSSWL
jgi:hypothetical protein